jgi:hypothetical protein
MNLPAIAFPVRRLCGNWGKYLNRLPDRPDAQ